MRKHIGVAFEAFMLRLARLAIRIPPIRWLLLKCYVAAHNEDGALKMTRKLHKTGCGVISNILGESAERKNVAEQFTKRYKDHIKNLAKLKTELPHIKLAISIKPSQIGLKCDKNSALELGLEILNECAGHDIGFEMDMEELEIMNDTVELAEKLADNTEYHHHRPIIRIAIPANQRISKDIVIRLAERKDKIGVRIVKGAYAGYFTKKHLVNDQFAKLAVLAAENNMNVALGTHDVELINAIKQSLNDTTIQMLFGIRPTAKKDFIYMCWGEKTDAKHYLERRMREGAKINVIFIFALNIAEAIIWRIKMFFVKNDKN